jgi:hypothetical protein
MNWTLIVPIAIAGFTAAIGLGTTQAPIFTKRLFLPFIYCSGIVGLITSGVTLGFNVAAISVGLSMNNASASELALKSRIAERLSSIQDVANTAAAIVGFLFLSALVGLYCATVKHRTSGDPAE